MPDCCSNSPGIPRRNFLKIGATTAAAGIMGVGLPVLISADEDDTSAHLIPADKKLTPAQLRAMCERGEPEWHEGDELTYVGMPVGGIGCGQLYIGGDGRLWHWDIFRPWYDSPYISSPYGALSSGHHYANPPTPDDPVQQPLQHGFALRIRQGDDETVRSLSADGFRKIRFRGEYPISRVEYRETFLPVEVDLEAFSPFIPLNADDSGLPCTLLNYTLRNTSDQPASVDLAGWMENAVCPEETRARVGRRRISFGKGRLTCSAHEPLDQALAQPRPPILIADFEGDDYGDWTVEGEAFGDHPFRKDELEDFDQLQGIVGEGLVNTHETRASGGDPAAADNFTGTLTSPEFEIERHYIVFKVGGGHPRKEARIELLIDGVPVASEAGGSDLLLRPAAFDVYDFEGKTAQIRIVDAVEGGWGHVAVDHITMEDVPPGPPEALDELPGFGTMALRMLGANRLRTAVVDVAEGAQAAFAALDERGKGQEPAETAFDARPAGAVGGSVTLGPGEERRVTFLLAWHFPHYRQIRGEMGSVIDLASLKRHYAARFADADAVADYVVAEFDRLAETTRLWNATWYDSTLPHWLLDRSFVSLNCLATTTLHWFDSGRVWGWEGTDCCPGTCQHVWNYAQGMARIFPELERSLRTVTDYGISFREDGALDYRGESSRMVAHDGQAGTIMRAWREHAISADDSFLRPIWPRVKKSVEYLMALDPDRNGILDCTQYNTLDAAWEGPMAWISSLYLGAVAAGAAMADDMGDADFAEACRAVVATGGKTLVDELYDGEYFIHKPDDGYEATNTNDGCHIDQVLGQSWAIQLGLERVVPESETGSALRSLWKYNFALDAGGYRNEMQDVIDGGRWYAMPGEAGLLMTTWPKGGAERAPGTRGNQTFVGYFNECMNGFEYQVAAHMIHEAKPGSDLVEKGVAITRAVHERYSPSKRNPYNEIECSDHYSRSMAGYGVFLGLCGFQYHGPNGHISFAPKLAPEKFDAAFTAAEGWGHFRQDRRRGQQTETIDLKWGKLRLDKLSFEVDAGHEVESVEATVDGKAITADLLVAGTRVNVRLPETLELTAGQALVVALV